MPPASTLQCLGPDETNNTAFASPGQVSNGASLACCRFTEAGIEPIPLLIAPHQLHMDAVDSTDDALIIPSDHSVMPADLKQTPSLAHKFHHQQRFAPGASFDASLQPWIPGLSMPWQPRPPTCNTSVDIWAYSPVQNEDWANELFTFNASQRLRELPELKICPRQSEIPHLMKASNDQSILGTNSPAIEGSSRERLTINEVSTSRPPMSSDIPAGWELSAAGARGFFTDSLRLGPTMPRFGTWHPCKTAPEKDTHSPESVLSHNGPSPSFCQLQQNQQVGEPPIGNQSPMAREARHDCTPVFRHAATLSPSSCTSSNEPDIYTRNAVLKQKQAQVQTERRNALLLQLRKAGYSYKAIKRTGAFDEAESTLRGLMRVLTKPKSQRVRRPVWKERDIALLHQAVQEEADVRMDLHGNVTAVVGRVPWQRVAKRIYDNGASYPFASATCARKWRAETGR